MRRPQGHALLHFIGTVVVVLSLGWLTLAGSFWTGPLASDSWLAPAQFAVCLPGIAMLFAAYFTAEKGRPSRAADWAEGASVTFVVWLVLATTL